MLLAQTIIAHLGAMLLEEKRRDGEREREMGRSGKKEEEEEGRRPKIVTRQVRMLLMVHMVLHVSGISCLL